MSDQNAQLVAELAGLWTEAPKPQSKETPMEAPAPSLEEQLDATQPAVKPAPIAQQMDKTHAIKAGGKGYVVTVEGEYYAKSVETKGHVIKPYTLRFNLPSLTNERVGPGHHRRRVQAWRRDAPQGFDQDGPPRHHLPHPHDHEGRGAGR
jgi:hypothetical protein